MTYAKSISQSTINNFVSIIKSQSIKSFLIRANYDKNGREIARIYKILIRKKISLIV